MPSFQMMRRAMPFDRGSFLVLALTASAAAILWAFVLTSVHSLQEADAAMLAEDAQQVADLIEGETARSLDVAVDAINRATDSFEHPDTYDRFEEILADLSPVHPEVLAIVSTDADGVGSATIAGWQHEFEQPNVKNFAFHQANRDPKLYLSLPYIGRISSQQQVFVSKRVDAPDGSIARIVGVTVSYDFFQQMISHARIGQHGTVSLERLDKATFAIASNDLRLVPGLDTSKAAVWRHFEESPIGTYRIASSRTKDSDRFVAYRRVRGMPLVAVVSVAGEDIASRSRAIARPPYLAATGATFGLAAIGFVALIATARVSRLHRISEFRRQTAHRARRQAEMANAAKSRFLANMSHELRTPLNAVLGFAETIRGAYVEPVGPRTRGYADSIAEAGEKLLLMLDELLEATDLESAQTPLDLEDLDLRAMVAHATERLSFEIAQRRIAIEIEGPADLPVHLNRRALRRILASLIANAVRFSPVDGRVRVFVARAGEALEIGVIDNGPGLPPEIAAHVGDPFVQNENPLTADISGTGVGLWVVKSLVERQGGILNAETTPGGGTTIVMRFGRANADAAAVP
ncbi:MAG: hypothetical protein GC202_09050 [Alphaproteobacteria bacterium]|nr:hypothetical protein [Alphaproteobacteria bacterium]